MEISFSNKLLSLRGICATRSLIPINSPPRKRTKHHDSRRGGGNPSAKLSTQSCQSVMKRLMEHDHVVNGARPTTIRGLGNIEAFRHKVALSNIHGDYLYEDVYMRSWDLAKGIVDLLGQDSPNKRICLLCPEDVTHVIAMWSCWLTGHTAVPLCPSRSQQRLEHIILDSKCDLVIVTAEHVNKVHGIAKTLGHKLIVLDDTWRTEPKDETDLNDNSPLPSPFYDKNDDTANMNALLVYTSGMTGRPKGVLVDHQTLDNQVNAVIKSWNLTNQDSILHSLPLDTLYGSINSVQAPLATGARVTTVPVNDNVKIWSHLLGVGVKSGNPLAAKINNITIFPSIPPVYKSLINSYSELFKDKKTKEYVKSACTKRLNLMVSSTSSLPHSVISQWKNISGHTIMDTFTATESGSGLESKETQLVKFRDHTKSHHDVLAFSHESLIKSNNDDSHDSVTGELRMKVQSKGEEEEWFYTGDLVEFSNGKYSLWGKLNVYNIQIGASLVNTVNVEKIILSNKDIDDCYVVGLGDVEGLQNLAAIIVLTKTRKVNLDNILTWCSENMNKDEVPTTFKIVSSIQRDKFGLINKSVLRKLFGEESILCFHDSTL